MAETAEKCLLMTRSELFAGIPSSVCTTIVSTARSIDFMCRQVMYFAGDPIEQIVLLTEGRVKITQCSRSEEHTSELQSHSDLVCRLLLEKKKNNEIKNNTTYSTS